MKSRVVVPALLASIAIAAAGAFAALSGNTFSAFSDTHASTPSSVGAAVVVLGRDGQGPQLGYEGLRPGVPQTVDLTVTYDGTVAAEVGISFGAESGSGFCVRTGDSWSTRPGAALTVAVGGAAEESYCSLLAGPVLPLGTAEPAPAGPIVVPVTFTLAADATPTSAGLEDAAVATVHADGGFTDRVDGRVSLTTAPADSLPGPPAGTPRVVTASLTAPDSGVGVALDGTDPATTARTTTADTGTALPTECLDAGIRPEDITEIVALDPALPVWDAVARRGRGAGPFLVLGTAGADTITGSTKGDCILGGAGPDEVSGGDGDDVVVGATGDDLLRGDAGTDHLLGGAGLDDLRGGEGSDVLDGGSGSATCDVTPADAATSCLPPSPPPLRTTAPPVPDATDPSPEPVAPAPAAPVEPTPEPETSALPAPADEPVVEETPSASAESTEESEPAAAAPRSTPETESPPPSVAADGEAAPGS